MRPDITFLTSSELQSALGNPLDADEMEDLRSYRDQLAEKFRKNQDVLERMEVVYGMEWRTFDKGIWVFDGNMDSISSPILLQKKSIAENFFEAIQMLAKTLIRHNPPDTDLVDKGYDRIEAVSSLLTLASLEGVVEEEDREDMIEVQRAESEDIKTWRKVEELADGWDREVPLFEWLDGR